MPTATRRRLVTAALVVTAAISIPSIGRAVGEDPAPAFWPTTPTESLTATTSASRAAPASPGAPTSPASSNDSSATGSTSAAPAGERSSLPSPSPTVTSSPAVSPPPARAGTALAAVAGLTVKGRAPRTGYDRAVFGQAWLDTDRNGCDTRNDVLRRDLRNLVLKAGTRGCLVLRGVLDDPYTGRTISFVRGQQTSTAVQIDHVVALADAWQKGAQQWTAKDRAAFANDPLALLAVDGPTNLRKGDGDTATWLPPNRAYRCAYVARQVAVKAKYGIWVTSAERDAMVRVLTACPDERLPVAAAVQLGGGREETVTAPKASPKPKPSAKTQVSPTPKASPRPKASAPAPFRPSTTDPRFKTCKAAKAAGYGPYLSGKDPEYDWYRDADKDGIVCE